MEIEAKCRLDLRTLQAVNGVAMFKKKEPRKILRRNLIVLLCCVAILLLSELLMLALGDSLPLWLFLVMGVCLLASLPSFFLYYMGPKRQYKKMGLRADMENCYVFGETSVRITATGAEGLHSEETIPYHALFKLMETNDYFFIFLDKIHTFPVDKRSMHAADIDTVRTRLTAAIPYTLCHY